MRGAVRGATQGRAGAGPSGALARRGTIAAMERLALLERSNRGMGLCTPLPEADRGVQNQHHHDDGEVGGMPGNPGEDRRDLDHPRDWSPEISGKSGKKADMGTSEHVLAQLGQAALGLFAREVRSLRPDRSPAAGRSDRPPPARTPAGRQAAKEGDPAAASAWYLPNAPAVDGVWDRGGGKRAAGPPAPLADLAGLVSPSATGTG